MEEKNAPSKAKKDKDIKREWNRPAAQKRRKRSRSNRRRNSGLTYVFVCRLGVVLPRAVDVFDLPDYVR